MPVRKFRSVEEMERPHWREPGDPTLYQTIERLWAFGQRTARYRFPPGVYRHRSMEELNAQTDAWSRARVSMHRENLTDDQRASVLRSEALWREAHAIAAAHPGMDPGDVYHSLTSLALPPSERLRRGLTRVRRRPHAG